MLQALSIGSLAWQALERQQAGEVIGVTSGGIFLRAAPKRLVFATYSPFRSPVTVNITPTGVDLQACQPGTEVRLSRDFIDFTSCRLVISLDKAAIWTPTYSHQSDLRISKPEVTERLIRVALAASHAKGPEGFAPALAWLADGAAKVSFEGDVSPELVKLIEKMPASIQAGNWKAFSEVVSKILGRGRGLTPSADDFIAGIMLILNRWGSELGYPNSTLDLNDQIIRLAYDQTTLISANIIEAAGLGQADERILSVVDGILLGDPNEALNITRLVNMGHSSGIDALAGAALALRIVLKA